MSDKIYLSWLDVRLDLDNLLNKISSGEITYYFDDRYTRPYITCEDKIINVPRFWGVSQNGQIIAGLTGNPVESIENSDFIIDAVIDSGKTKEKFQNYKQPFLALIDKKKEREEATYKYIDLELAIKKFVYNKWIIFPWEINHNYY